jgi:hypothetical protein
MAPVVAGKLPPLKKLFCDVSLGPRCSGQTRKKRKSHQSGGNMRLFIHPARAMVVPARLSHDAQGIHRRNLLRRPVAVACLMALGAVVSVDVFANCSPTAPAADTTVTCSGPTFIGNPFASSSNNLTFNVQPGGQVTSLLGISNAVLLSGTGNTVNNSGTIDPSLLGALSLLSGGVQLGSANASNQSVNNYGSLMGTASLISVNVGGGSLAGLALDVRNNTGGTTTIYNAGTISTTPLLGVSLVSADAPVIAVSGYGVVNMTNDTSGTITGRVAFEGGVNTFVNHGAISGSVYLAPVHKARSAIHWDWACSPSLPRERLMLAWAPTTR